MSSIPSWGWGVALLVASWAPVVWAQDGDEASLLAPEDAVAAALAGAPDVRAAEARLGEARGLLSQSALFLRNPSVGVSVGVDGERFDAEILQPLSLSGEGRQAHRTARAEIGAAEAALRRVRLETAAEVRRAYVEAAAQARLTALSIDGSDLARRLREAVARKHDLGEAALLDVRLARMAEADAAVHVLEARGEVVEALRELAAILRGPVQASALIDDVLAVVPAPDEAGEPRLRADVLAARAAVEAAEAQLAWQRAATIPPVGVGAFVEREDGVLAAGPALSLTLPIFDRNQVGRASALGELALAEAEARAVEARAETERITAAERLTEARALVEGLGGDLEAEAREALASIEAGYRAGQIDLSTAVLLQAEVIEGLRATVLLERRLAEARLDLLLAREDEALIGGGAR